MYSKVLSLKGRIVNRAKQRGEFFYCIFFLSLSNESRTLPLHLWQLLALTHRNERFRDKGGDGSGLGCVNPFVSRRISFHGTTYRLGLHRLSERKLERHYSRPLWLMNLLFSRLLRDFIDRKHRFVAGSQVNDRAQRSEPPTVDFVPVETIDRTISSNFPLPIYRNFSHWPDLSSFFLPSSLFLSSFFFFFLLFLFLLLTQFLTLLPHVPRNFSFKTDQRVHFLFLRSMLHDRLTYKPRTR